MRMRARWALVGFLVAGVLASQSHCGGERRPGAVSADRAVTIPLDTLPFTQLEIPSSSRPDHAEPPVRIPVRGPYKYLGTTRAEMHKYCTDIPIRPRSLFFYQPKPGMKLLDRKNRTVIYDRSGGYPEPIWHHDRQRLCIHQPDKDPPPADGDYHLEYPRAVEREQSLNLADARRRLKAEHEGKAGPAPELAAKDFVWTSIVEDWDTRRGLLLPAPGVAQWKLEVPAAAELQFSSGLVRPEIQETVGSDGAELHVEVVQGGEVTPVKKLSLDVGRFKNQRIDLSAYAGKTIELRLRTEPGGNPVFDYAFLAEPVVASRIDNPVRVVMVFIDTLRPDHMSLYGYERDTTASIDGLKDRASVFTQARSVAPWTLPSARAIVTGRHPEKYDSAKTLQETLHQNGFATAFMAGNVYLSSNFGMARDWDFHRVGLWPMAKKVTDDTLAWLDEHEGRNALVQVHYMDPHLPYLEPGSYRNRYAGQGPDGLRGEFHLRDVRRQNIQKKPKVQQYIRDRYDNNIRYATDQIARLLKKLDENDIVLLYADHGEEFWEHQGFEHGHSLFDELPPRTVGHPSPRARGEGDHRARVADGSDPHGARSARHRAPW